VFTIKAHVRTVTGDEPVGAAVTNSREGPLALLGGPKWR